ncbi:MAG TPA: APC family permease, partial [Rhodanobacteraceae bacterium]
PGGHGHLTDTGLAISAALVVAYFLLNYWSVKIFAHSNTVITIFKMVIPTTTALLLIASGFDAHNFTVGIHGGPHHTDFASVLTAVAIAGIVFSFNGFQSPVNLAGEARNPGKTIPFAVVVSILLAAAIYVLLQVAYIGAVPADMLANIGWHGINFRSPFADLAMLLGLQYLSVLLFADAVVSPSGTGMTYTATTARMIYGMERNGTLPKIFGRIHPRFGVPRPAMWLNLVVSFIFMFFFRGWGTLAAVISVATVISYLTGPVSVMTLRHTAPDLHRPLRIAGMPILACLAFVFSTELLYWARWPLTGEIIVLMAVALPVYFYYQWKARWHDFGRQLRGSWWLIAYLPAMALVSYLGSATFGGINVIPYGWDLVVVALVGAAFYFWGVKCGWRTPSIEAIQMEAKANPDELLVPPDEEEAERVTGH